MRVQIGPLRSNGYVIAEMIDIPETLIEKFIGLRYRKIKSNTAMLFILSKSKSVYEIFDTFLCQPIGFMALDKSGKVLKAGILQSNKIIGIKCSYWLEISPERIYGINIGDIIKGLN